MSEGFAGMVPIVRPLGATQRFAGIFTQNDGSALPWTSMSWLYRLFACPGGADDYGAPWWWSSAGSPYAGIVSVDAVQGVAIFAPATVLPAGRYRHECFATYLPTGDALPVFDGPFTIGP